MKSSTSRILTTHVGSLIRPPALQDFLRAKQAGKPYDQAAYDACLKDSVAEVVRKQAETGVDVVSDGEFGKSISWSQYVLERLSGFERRPIKDGADPFARGVDRERFPEFYAELDARDGRATTSDSVCVGPIVYTGQAELQRDIDNLRAALDGVAVEEAFLPVAAPASVIPDRKNEYYKSDEECLEAIAQEMRTEYRMIVDAGFLLQLDDARAAVTYDRMVPPASFEDYRNWVARHVEVLNHAIDGIPQEKMRYHVCWGSWPGAAHERRAVEGHRRSDSESPGRRLCHRRRQPAPRARMEGVARRQAAGGENPHRRRGQPRDQHRRASGTDRRAHRAARPRARPRERDGRHRLRLRARPVPPPRPPQHHVGEACSARGGSEIGE
jgi:methionine synthase II (cobalamin-independent)